MQQSPGRRDGDMMTRKDCHRSEANLFGKQRLIENERAGWIAGPFSSA
jgi:hypothetical protein